MFQSVAPCPGKVAFEVEPFPVPSLQVVREEQSLAAIPVADPVVATPAAAPAVDVVPPVQELRQPISPKEQTLEAEIIETVSLEMEVAEVADGEKVIESPFLISTGIAEPVREEDDQEKKTESTDGQGARDLGDADFSDEFFQREESTQHATEQSVEDVSDTESAQEAKSRPLDSQEAPSPSSNELKKGDFSASKAPEPDLFRSFQSKKKTSPTVEVSTAPSAPAPSAPAQKAAVQPSVSKVAVTNWQPPTATERKKKKATRFGGLFRQ